VRQSFAVLVLSCDKYSDVWPAFFKCFRENFPAGDWPVYLGSNTKECHEPGIVTVLSGSDPDWSTSYKRILEQIPQKKIFVILEDLFLSSKVNVDEFTALVKFMFEREVNHIKYWANPLPDLPTDNRLVGEYAKGAPFRSTVCGLWDRDCLLSLLIEGENPWDFEIMGSYRTSYSDGFYTTTAPLCNYKNMIEKGRWIPASVEWARTEGLALELDKHSLPKRGRGFVSLIKMGYFDLMIHVPWRWRVALMNKLRRAFISY